ncbi:MAG: hypothetical protein ABEL76_01645 [Bradymonadaceae bacterium]
MSVIPDFPEAVIILIVTLCIVGLGKVGAIGEAVWRLREKLSPATGEPADDLSD